MKSTIRIAGGVILVLTLLVFASALAVSAQGPSGTSTPEAGPTAMPSTSPTPAAAPPLVAGTTLDDPAKAAAIGAAAQAIPAGTGQWFSFTYNNANTQLPRPTVTVRLLNGVTNHLRFEIYAPESFMDRNWFDGPPVGRGTQEVLVGCSSSSDGSGHCPTNDLIWSGGFGLNGTYFVRVVNDSTENVSANMAVAPQLIVSGPGVTQCVNPGPGSESVPGNITNNQGFTAIDCSGNAQPTPAPIVVP